MFLKPLVLLWLLQLLLLHSAHALYFEDGFDHHYTYSSESDILGLHNVTTVIKFRIRSVNQTASGGSLCLLMMDSFVQHSDQGYVSENPMNWKLDHKFFFTVGHDGVVTLVHFHPEEKDEVLSLKKVLASTLSTKVTIESGESVITEEEDHAGILEQEYTAKKFADGVRITRGHKSSKDVHRSHNKTTHIDWMGTPLRVDSTDNITLRSAPTTISSTYMDEAAEIPEEQSGEFPKIASISKTKVKLKTKSKHYDQASTHSLQAMHEDTLLIREKPKPKLPLSSMEADIRKFLACIHAIANKYDRNRTECVHQLRSRITSLERDDFIKLGEDALTKYCPEEDVICADERNLFIDLISHEGSPDAQLMVLNHVLKNPNATEDDIRRCLFHCIAIKSPVMELVEHVKELCFADDAEKGDTPVLTKNRKRACLSLGAMAKSLHDNNITESDRIVEKIENWLQHHNETKSAEIIKSRRRRSIIQYDSVARRHVETKMVLIQSLGNAGKKRSIHHIKSYMEPNMGVTAWRRAAIHSLRHFDCDESAHGLLISAANDDDGVVRQAALKVLEKHPKRDKFTEEHENVVLSKAYTYSVAARVRRGLLEALKDGILINVNLPGFEWAKTLGNHAIGASFGLYIRNSLSLKLGLLDGHFSIDVYDGAFAEAHVGVVNFQVDIIKAYICFKGHIKYDLNVLKDFNINGLSDLVHIYDKILAEIMDPIMNAVTNFKEIIMDFQNRTLTNIVNTLVLTVKNLPHILGDVAIKLDQFVNEIFFIAGSTVIEEIKVIVREIRTFINVVQADLLKFYNGIVDAVTVALPYIAKKVVETFNLIVEGTQVLIENPLQAITAMSRAVNNLKMAVVMLTNVKAHIMDSCKFLKGRVAEWFNTDKQIPQILKRLTNALEKITITIQGDGNLVEDVTSVLSDGVEQTKNSLRHLEEDLRAKWESVFTPLRSLLNITKPFVDELKVVMDVIKELKLGYNELKKTIENSKKLVQKVFGPKFHRGFPTERRPKQGSCPEGVWPSTTLDEYDTTGVDLLLGVGQSIKNPVNGIVNIQGNRVTVKPTDAEFSGLQIVVENINVLPEIADGKMYPAGQKLGRASKAPKCTPNFIHVSVREASEQDNPDADYKYTDPGPFLDRLIPIPKWFQECNDHEFRYIGQTFDSNSGGDEEPGEKKEEIPRFPKDFVDMDELIGPESPHYRPDDPTLYDQTPFGENFKDTLGQKAKEFKDLFKTALFGEDGLKIPNILSIINVNAKKMKWILDNLKDNTITSELNVVIGGLCSQMTALPTLNPLTFDFSYLMNLLKMNGFSFKTGNGSSFKGWSGLSFETGNGFSFKGWNGLSFEDGNGVSFKFGDISTLSGILMQLAEKACPLFRRSIAVGFGHMCSVQDDCLGISCEVALSTGAEKCHVPIGISVKPGKGQVEVTADGRDVKNIIADGVDAEIDLQVSVCGMQLYMVSNLEFKSGVLSLSAEVKLCEKLFSTCLPPVELFHDIRFNTFYPRHRRGVSKDKICDGLIDLSIPIFIGKLADYRLLTRNVTSLLEKVRSSVVKELLDDPVDKLGDISREFVDKVDFCLSENIPVPPFDVEFFDLRYRFFVGPVPLSLGFGGGGSVGIGVKVGLCVLSMTTQLTVIPWVGGKVWGDAAVDIGFARAGIRLIGYLLETQFSILTELVFSKYPIDVGAKMDLSLTPLRLQLKAFAELKFPFGKRKTVFDATLWKYSVPKINKNIFHKKKSDIDESPPEITPATINKRRKREGHRGCIVRQIQNRPHYSPAFTLEMHAKDEVSEVKLFYAIGTHRGGTNVVDWTEMGGASLLAPSHLPGGIPLYWTVKARNSQGLEAIQQCMLNTYDSTLPDGRVEHAYKYSSHPAKLKASVIVFEDSPLMEPLYKAVGFSPGQFGSQFVDWMTLSLDHTVIREGVTGYLKHFTIPREGKLVAWVLETQHVRNPELCAETCFQYGQNCVSFDYEYHSETCDLHDVVQSANAYLRISGTYSNYERLGSGYHTPIEYDNLQLKHGASYFVNSKITNVLGYDAYLIGEGTMVDFTPPEPGLIRSTFKDILKADQCKAAVTQRCIDVTWKENHRLIIDGEGSETVFNGHQPVFDQLYTLTNHFVTANWKGFHDDESGIWGYTWAVGRQICGSDVIAFEDPYTHLTSKKFWTDSAFHKGIHLEDGAYYVTVQALNGAELGGSLVTTVCHSTPFIVDTSPPVINKVTDIIYDEDFDLIAIYYNATDSLSKIAKAEFGLGKTKYDVQLKSYSLHASMDRNDPFVAVEELGLKEGIPAWLRIRITNHVDLFSAGHGDEPILIDRSPPIPGQVFDGERLRQDRMYQANDANICAQWVDFYDPESGLDRFIWGVGTAVKLDDVVKFHNLTHYDKSSCASATLKHNHTYFSTVFAFNNALNSKSCNSSSDGVLIDVTTPIPGVVFDGEKGKEEELGYSSETVSKFANWRGYHDPESGIAGYKVGVFINNEHKKTFDVNTATDFEDHTISMEHLDRVYFSVHGINGAELEASAKSDGFLVDHTPPLMKSIADNNHGSAYQSDNKNMHLSWDFSDGESYIKEYRTLVYVTKFGEKNQFWPDPRLSHYNTTKPISPTNGRVTVKLEQLSMDDGAVYSLYVTALNGALLATSHETVGVTVDTSPPSTPKIRLGLPNEDEEIDDEGRALHHNQRAIRFSWTCRDPESGIEHYMIAIGTDSNPEKIRHWKDFGTSTMAYIQHIYFQTFTAANQTYIASIKAINGAGLESPIGKSKQIYIQKANIPGLVFDGRNLFEDEMYTLDRTSIAASFYGFESESCNIIGYEWAIGTTEYGTDVISYTDYGVVMLNDTHGQAQIHQELYEDTTYYITVRAVTGCREEYILATSDGITLDLTPPKISFTENVDKYSNNIIIHDVMFQSTIDNIALTATSADTNSIKSATWALGSLPYLDDMHSFTTDLDSLTTVSSLQPGQATFLIADIVDKAGNRNITSSMAIMSDNTAPEMKDLTCTQYLSYRKSVLNCAWYSLVEYESLIDTLKVSLSANDGSIFLDNLVLPKRVRTYTRDLYYELNGSKKITVIYATFDISNVVNQTKTYAREVTVDLTEPDFEGLDVVTSLAQTPAQTHQKCQLPTAYAELQMKGVQDKESGIDTERFKVSIGLKPYGTDILNYVDIKQRQDGTFFVDGYMLDVGTVFFATLRIYNKAGLYADVTSDSVVVSQSPYLTVIDGNDEEDVDYQSLPNLIQGRWEYSDLCPISEAFWLLKDILGNALFDFQRILDAGKRYYNDEVALENGKKYIVTVKTIDALGRTKYGRSDGITVRIQPPFPGIVRDGKGEDLNYQYSNTELSANWDTFGDNTNDPTQSIRNYEVAIGNDRRYEMTRSNVYYFINVGLNTSYTFKHLNLTKKLVRYYITVRSYSMAGGYSEGYSNGIRVGYNDEIVPGTITVNSYQSSTDSMDISWTGFQSDMDILLFKVGISSHMNIISNDTLHCSYFGENATIYDVFELKSVGLNEYVKIRNLSLKHNRLYYVIVVAMDEAGMCTAITSTSVLVDTTPPTTGKLYINNVESNVISFAMSNSEILVSWTDCEDPESGITQIKVSLSECSSCHPNLNSGECVTLAENIVQNDVKTAFYGIEYFAEKSYVVKLEFKNRARLVTSVSSATLLIDSTPPLIGTIKITSDWGRINEFQHSTSEIQGLIALAGSEQDYICRNQMQLFPSEDMRWNFLSSNFLNDFLVTNKSGLYLGIGYSSDLSSFSKSGIVSDSHTLERGNYSFVIRTAAGQNIITTAAFLSSIDAIPFTIVDKPDDAEFDFNKFDNISGLVTSNDNETDPVNVTFSQTTIPTSGDFVNGKDTDVKKETPLDTEQYGFGVHFLGYKIGNNRFWWHLFWARNKITHLERWFRLTFDPTNSNHEYKILVKPKDVSLDTDMELVLFVDDDEIVSISGFLYNSDMKLSYLTWNENGYEPPIKNIFSPFYGEASVIRIDVPDFFDKPCLHGRGFFDGESGIKEIHVGISDSKSKLGNIVPINLYKSFCFPCIKPCIDKCKIPCNDTRLTDGFTLVPLQIRGMNLKASNDNDTCLNASSGSSCNSTAYYINAKLVNFAGKEAIVYSNGIQLDITPPIVKYVKCIDPEYGEDVPTNHIGSSSTIGAYWDSEDDISQIEYHTVAVISSSGEVIMNSTLTGQKTKGTFHVGDGAFENDHNYVVKVTAVNTAGLATMSSCSVHVNLYPPDVTLTSAEPLYIENFGSVMADGAPYWTTSQTDVGVSWNGGTDDTEFYEWRVGTAEGAEDVFPSVKVGQESSGSAAIVNGKLHLDGNPSNITMHAFRDRTNLTADEIDELDAVSEPTKSFFYMEPGRCMYLSLYALGYSHLRSKIKGRTVCIKRPEDVNVNASSPTTIISKAKLSNVWLRKTISDPEFVIDVQITSGGISVGTLNKTDKNSDYGSAATIDYRPFIADPSVTGSQTTRMLRNRIERFCDRAFYVSPSPSLTFEEININVTISSSCDNDPDYQPALIYWDMAEEKWTHTDEGCFDKPMATMDFSKNIYMAKVCRNDGSNRNKRSSEVTMESPRAYELVRISRTFSNGPPIIVSDIITTKEDNFTQLYVETTDPDNDMLIFEIYKQPENAVCAIGNTTGLLNCTLEPDFYGDNKLYVRVTETGLPPNEHGHTISKDLTLSIEGTPDKTARFFLDPVGTLHKDIRPFLHLTVMVEANNSASVEAGTIILADMDGGEVFIPQTDYTSLGSSTFKLTDVELQGNNHTIMFNQYRSVHAYNISFSFSPSVNGKMTLSFIAKTADDKFTPSITIHLFVLNNPCVFGRCIHPILGTSACESTDRAESFDGYSCVCTLGYEGTWCEIEINECDPDSCSSMYDCQDLINGYECTINIKKLMLILFCCAALLIGVGFGIFKLRERCQENSQQPISPSLPDRPENVAKVRLTLSDRNQHWNNVNNGELSLLTSNDAMNKQLRNPIFNTKANQYKKYQTTLTSNPFESSQSEKGTEIMSVEEYCLTQRAPRCSSAASHRSVSGIFLEEKAGEMAEIDV